MKQTFVALVFEAVVLVHGVVAQPTPHSPIPSDSEIRQILVERIDKERQSVGIVVGVIEPRGRRIIAYGNLDKVDKRPVDGDTIFELGSVTKVFTAFLLADMAHRGEVGLTDPVAKYLPAEVKMPERGGRQITLQDLATHTSGLPPMPSNFEPKDANNPFADYSVKQLYQFLSGYQLTRDIGSQYEYSNVGGGLLGQVLATRAGMNYDDLLRSRICELLSMNDTRITLSKELRARLAIGHDQSLEPASNWDMGALAGAGALKSTANDLLVFLAANLGYTKSPLSPALAIMLKTRKQTGVPGLEIALGWHISTHEGQEIIWHNGATGGYRAFVGYSLKSKVGVVVLSNAYTTAGIDDIGQHLLDIKYPLYAAPKQRKEVAVDPKLFEGYVGRFQIDPDFILTVTQEGNHLFVQATGQPRYEVFAEGEKDYFFKIVDAQITFETDIHGRATGLVLHQDGDSHGTRIDDLPATSKGPIQ